MDKILLYNSGGGLGDSIQLFPLILSLQNNFKSSKFYYLGAHDNHFQGKLKEYNINIKTLDLNLKYFGFRWWHLLVARDRFNRKNLKEIDLIIDLQSKLRNTMILKRIPSKFFYSSTLNYFLCSKNVKGQVFKKTKNYKNDTLLNLKSFLDNSFKTIKFSINTISKKYLAEARRLLPYKNYIGLSLTQGNIYRKKSWSLDNFIELAIKIKKKDKTPVFFVEKEKTELINKIKNNIPNALFPEHQSKISCPALVTALSSRLEKAVSIDNGVMHMISLSNIPMIVLFGPTDSKKFAPKNDKVKILDSKKIYNSNDINSITVEEVEKLI